MKDISLHILDITENSTNAGADKITLKLEVKDREDIIRFTLSDNGCGMTEDMVRQLQNPFFTTRTTRKVGLGIPLLIQNTEQTGGKVQISSESDQGTTLSATFFKSHLDCPPLGDLADVLVNLIASFPRVLFEFILESESDNFAVDSKMVKDVFGENLASQPEVIHELKSFIRSNINNTIIALK